MRARIHRGTKEIGGTCVELESSGVHILLDLGLPLDGDPSDPDFHPQVEGLTGSGCLEALILSHGHVDHWGLAHLCGEQVPVFLGQATYRILEAAAPFVPRPYIPKNKSFFQSGTIFQIGPFRIKPYLVDHSAYDAYAFEVEADGKRLFYSGDFRGHGRKAALFDRMLNTPPQSIDVMLMEGSSLGRIDTDARFPSEAEVENDLHREFSSAEGIVLVAASAQNIDRMVSLFRACKRSGRTLLIDLYAAEILRATGNKNIPQSDWPNVAVYVPQYQRIQIKKARRFDLIDRHKDRRVYIEKLAALAPSVAMLFRPAMLRDLEQAQALNGSVAIWSQWDGYLLRPKGEMLVADLRKLQVPLKQIHTSGHASIVDLR